MTMLNEKCLVNGKAISLKIVVMHPMLFFLFILCYSCYISYAFAWRCYASYAWQNVIFFFCHN